MRMGMRMRMRMRVRVSVSVRVMMRMTGLLVDKTSVGLLCAKNESSHQCESGGWQHEEEDVGEIGGELGFDKRHAQEKGCDRVLIELP